MRCRACGKELRANNKAGIHTACMTSADRMERVEARYKHSATDQRGDADEWANAARALFGDPAVDDNNLKALGFSEVPTAAELKKRYRELMLENHPDRGGDAQRAAEINTAYVAVLKRISSK
jgi:DnaJ-domain-containing protein 1